jgi:uncharacterized protein with PIN domain
MANDASLTQSLSHLSVSTSAIVAVAPSTPTATALTEPAVDESKTSISSCRMAMAMTTAATSVDIKVSDMKELDDLNQVIGRGSGSLVKLFYHRSSRTRVALKIIDRFVTLNISLQHSTYTVADCECVNIITASQQRVIVRVLQRLCKRRQYY